MAQISLVWNPIFLKCQNKSLTLKSYLIIYKNLVIYWMSKDFYGHVSVPKSLLVFTCYLYLPTFSRLKCLTNLLQGICFWLSSCLCSSFLDTSDELWISIHPFCKYSKGKGNFVALTKLFWSLLDSDENFNTRTINIQSVIRLPSKNINPWISIGTCYWVICYLWKR